MDWRRLGRLVVTVHTEAVPSEEDWAEYMSGVDDIQPLDSQRIFVVSAGGGPTGVQRKMMTDALAGTKVPVAILTNSWLMRGAAIAVRWFNPSLAVFAPDAMDAAFNYLELTTWERNESARITKELQRALGIRVTATLPPSSLRDPH
jgi:hypothetical protein